MSVGMIGTYVYGVKDMFGPEAFLEWVIRILPPDNNSHLAGQYQTRG